MPHRSRARNGHHLALLWTWSVWAEVADGSAQAAPKHKVREDEGLKAIQAAKAVTQAKKLGL